jgi:hypothetical protein
MSGMAASLQLAGRALGALLCAVPAGCLTDPVRRSEWPPPDFLLEVYRREAGQETARVRYWADGLAVYGEATSWVGGEPGSVPGLPVYGRLAVYRLHPDSVRQLARSLARAGLYDADLPSSAGEPLSGEVVAVHLRAFENDRTLVGFRGSEGPVVRAIHLANAYAPPGGAIAWRDMPGEPEPGRVSRVPEPRDSVEGALEVHQHLLEAHPDDIDLLAHAAALAVAAGRADLARPLLARLAAEPATEELVARLRRLL